MAIAAVNEPVEKRLRSPSVPFIGLITAITRARELYNRAGQNGVSVADAADAWKLRATSSVTRARFHRDDGSALPENFR